MSEKNIGAFFTTFGDLEKSIIENTFTEYKLAIRPKKLRTVGMLCLRMQVVAVEALLRGCMTASLTNKLTNQSGRSRSQTSQTKFRSQTSLEVKLLGCCIFLFLQ
jgi:phosphoribosylaminoimidazole-succinocarboxamide synthase